MSLQGFFPESDVTAKKPLPLIARCGECGLYKGCLSPKMPISGEGGKGILIVGEAPGADEDKMGRQFVGVTGQYLRDTLRRFGVDLRADCWLTNSVICRPPKNVLPPKAVEYCQPNLVITIHELKPTTIILLGGAAIESLIGWLWRENPGDTGRWVGWQIPNQRLNAWVCPTWHPSYVKRCEDENFHVPKLMFEKHLEAALTLKGRPFDEVPDYSKQVEIVYDTDEAAKILRKMIEKGGRIAFDYESTTLKPEGSAARLLCAAVCWRGKKTIAFPWHGEAVVATKELLKSDSPKVAANLKFEHRWTKTHLRCEVRNWEWDTVVAAHVLDNRPGVAGLKFQAFALLGQESYDDKLDKFKKGGADKANALGDRSKVSTGELLLYCGLDALLTYKISEIQMKQVTE